MSTTPAGHSLATDKAPSVMLPLRYMAVAVVDLAFLATLLVFLASDLVGAYFTPHVLAFTHLATLGWISMTMMGALYQLVPVALGVRIFSEKIAELQFWIFGAGVAALALGFWYWNILTLIVAGTLLIVAVALFLFNMLRTLTRVTQWNISGLYIANALIYFGAVTVVGGMLILNKPLQFLATPEYAALAAHVHLAAVGWVTLTIAGASYRLIPMFGVVHDPSERAGRIALALINVGLIGLFFALWSDTGAFSVLACGAIVAIGIAVYIVDIVKILRARLRKHDIGMRHFEIALIYFVAASVYGIGAALNLWSFLPYGAAPMIYALLAFGGWITLTIMGMLHKIVPFLVWINKYSPRIGKERVPLLRDMFSERIGNFALGLFNIGLLAEVGAVIAQSAEIARVGAVVLATGVYLFAFNILSTLRK